MRVASGGGYQRSPPLCPSGIHPVSRHREGSGECPHDGPSPFHFVTVCPTRRLRPFAPAAPLVLLSRARRPSSGCLPPPPASARSSPARLFLRAASHPLRPCRTDRSPGKGVQATNPVNAHFVCVSDSHARSRKGSVTAPPPRLTLLSVEPQRVTRASPCRPPSPSPSRPTASRQRPP